MDEFKRYLRENKNELDIDHPGSAVWDHIERSSDSNKYFLLFGVAASFFIMLLLTVMFTAKKEKSEIKYSEIVDHQKIHDSAVVSDLKSPAIHLMPASQLKLRNGAYKTLTAVHKYKVDNTEKEPPENASVETFGQMQNGFAIIINKQLEQIRNTPIYAEAPDYFSLFKKEFQDLDIQETEIRAEIQENGLNDSNIGKLINIYQEKLITLKHLQTEINKTNSHTENKVRTNKPGFINI